MTSFCACKHPTGEAGENCSVCGFLVSKPGISSNADPPVGVIYVPPGEMERTNKTITVYICPTPECGDYYGSNGMGDLSKEFTGPKVEDKGKLEQETGSPYRHSRAECPTCRTERQIHVERIPITVTVAVPVIGPPIPPLPPRVGGS